LKGKSAASVGILDENGTNGGQGDGAILPCPKARAGIAIPYFDHSCASALTCGAGMIGWPYPAVGRDLRPGAGGVKSVRDPAWMLAKRRRSGRPPWHFDGGD